MNERKKRFTSSRPATQQGSTLYTMEEMLESFGNERATLSITTTEDQAFPFILSDGLTIYFASKGHETIGGYDLFVSRYNLYSDTYLNQPIEHALQFAFQRHMMVIDEQKA